MKKLLYIVLVLLSLSSCEDYIDVKPKGLIVPKTEQDLDLFLMNSDISYCGDLSSFFSDDLFIPFRHLDYLMQSDFDEQALAYSLSDEFYTITDSDETWGQFYKAISSANYVLEQLKQVSIQNQNLANKLEGEALVHRAFSYFMLVNIYAQHYGVGNASEAESGVPLLRNFADTETSLQRATTQEVYSFILNDLQTAIPLLKEVTDFNHRPNLCAAHTLQAKCFLHMKDYEKAKNSIDNAFLTLPAGIAFLNYREDLEDYGEYYSLPFDNVENQEVIFNKSFEAPNFYNDASLEFIALTYYSHELVALFDLEYDLRISKLAIEDEEDGKVVYNYMGYDDGGGAFLGITLPELYLIRAELFARDNQVAKAMDDLNAIRVNRFTEGAASDLVNLTANDGTEAFQKVMEERRRELAFSGLRMIDIKRLNANDNANIVLSRVIDRNGNVKSWKANSKNWALPIAPKYIDLNPEIKQNERE